MHRGVEIDLGLKPGLSNEGFVAEALGNLAAFTLSRRRGERLDWQVIRVETPPHHHYRLVVRHPDRVLDLGFARDLGAVLRELSAEDVAALRTRLQEAIASGLKPVRLRHLKERADYWHDDFWNWLG